VGANSGSGNVSIVEIAPQGPPAWKLTVIPAGKRTEGVDVSPDGKEAWAANKNDGGGGATIFDLPANQVKQTIDLHTKHANRLHFTPDGKYGLLLDREGEELLIIDAATREVAKRVRFEEKAGQSLTAWDFSVAPHSSRAVVTVNVGSNPTRYREDGQVNRAD